MADTVSGLLPCPFCGQEGKALIGPIRDGAAVCCSNFSCLGKVQAFNPNAREKAIIAWNTRASTQHAPAFPREEATDAMVLAGTRVWLGEGLQKVPADWVERMRLTWCAMRAALLQGKQP